MADEAKAKGNAALSAGKFTKAVKHFTDAIILDPKDHLLYSYRSDAYAFLDQYSEALSDAKKTVHLKPDWCYGHARVGAAHCGLKQYGQAINHFNVAINLDPTNHVLYFNRSDAYASLNRYSEALSDAMKNVHLKPDWSYGYILLGEVHHRLKHYDEAVLAYKKGLELDPSDEVLKFRLKHTESLKLGSGRPGIGSSIPKDRKKPANVVKKELEKEHEKGLNNFCMRKCREIDLVESTKSLNRIALKHNELLLAHTSDIKRLTEKITAECKELYEAFNQKCIQLEAENKLLQEREDELKKTEVDLKNRERKIVKEKSKLESNKRGRELLSSCKQLGNDSSRKEDEDRQMELYALHKRTMELEDQVKVQNESLQRARMELETALQVSEDEDGMDLEEKLENLQSEFEKKREELQDWKNSEKDLTSAFNVKDNELQDAQLELIDGMKATHHWACIGVKTLDVGKGPGHTVQQLWHNKEKREASVIECIVYIMKKWKAEQNQTMN